MRHDAVLAGALGALILMGGLARHFGWIEAIAAAAACLPLAWRSRWPLAVLGAVVAVALAHLTFANPFPAFVLPLAIAVYTVAARGSRRRTLVVGAALVPTAIAIVLLFSPDDGSDLRQTFEIISQFGFVLAVGEAVRSQRALFGAMRERAERAERDHEIEARRRVDEERMRIARDVHDVVAHSLATVSTQAAVGVYVGRDDPERAVEALQAIKQVSTSALHDLRSALGTLREDSSGAPTRPAPTLHELADLVATARSAGLGVVLRMEGSPAGLPTTAQLAVYRIVQEGLTNVMRHAGAGTQTTVRIVVTSRQVEVEVRDDGSGRPATARPPGSGSGLIGMRERAAALGGTFEAGPTAGGGFRVRAVIGLEEAPA